MKDAERAEAVRGKTIRLKWTEGPTKGKTYEHVFHPDGTVEWHDSDGAENAPTGASQKAAPAKERAEYGAMRVADQIYAVSYLAPSGFTLTVVLNFRDGSMVGFASGTKDWFPLRGSFEVVK
jgi:molybdenum cofactor biosynthesis protein MoaF